MDYFCSLLNLFTIFCQLNPIRKKQTIPATEERLFGPEISAEMFVKVFIAEKYNPQKPGSII